ncbi:MAG: electron transport complex subunit RsxC [Limnochordia bacterium]|jgi:electron transport complex protein RnfC|nr:electron transport complex subunit RsxC [Bacillota bacterium]NLL08186.1 electron transport complex subunit RsxC [Bacillota bacterium]HBG10466.1 electron transport complex subunit RsxC [Bacillota bacterium]
MQRTFPRGGGDIPHRKSATDNKPIVVMPAPAIAVIPLQQHIGAPCEPVVAVGDKVKMGQLIGQSKQFISAPVHSSVSGQVLAIEERPLTSGAKTLCVVIKNDGRDEPASAEKHADIRKLSASTIRQAVRDAGIVGMGGAGFPTHVKLNPPKPVDTILINGAECEPYLTCDHRLMAERADEMVQGLLAMIKAVGAAKGVIGIEANKPDAISQVQAAIADYDQLSVAVLQVRYPQGAEKQLIKAILNREVPSVGLPHDVGCVVSNVHTAIAVYQALSAGKSSYERVVTVSGGAVVDPRNVLVRVGTPIEELFNFCGGFLGEPEVLVCGGPMTGPPIKELSGPVVKNLSGVLALTREEAAFDENLPCIRCERCVRACPMGLTPNLLGEYSEKGMYREAERLHLKDCIECSLCSYVCPAKRALVTWIKQGKAGLAAEKAKEKVS